MGSSPPGFAPGLVVGNYEIIAALGEGGMGHVFRAWDRRLDRDVALKVLHGDVSSDPDRLKRFETEAKALAGLNHANIVVLYEVSEFNGQRVLVMEFVDGETLRARIQRPGLSTADFHRIAMPIADALSCAHEKQIIHRDLKPENVMVTREGHVKVLDFGLAKRKLDEQTLTVDGAVLGTVAYMSPEQVNGFAVDTRSDIFSLGVMFYEMLTGDRPFRGATPSQIWHAIVYATPVGLSQVRRDVSPELADLVRRCLAKEPHERFQAVRDLKSALEHAHGTLRPASGSGQAVPTPAAAPAREAGSVPSRMAGVWQGLLSLDTRSGLTVLLVFLFAFNWAETSLETALGPSLDVTRTLGLTLASAAHWSEGYLSFARHDLAGPMAVYAGSLAYFVLPPALGLLTLLLLAGRPAIGAYRTFVFAITANYAVSLIFYLCFPMPERWAFPDSEAILLSDLWSARLIEAFRPISGLDNSFPSFHVSSTVNIVAVWYLFRLRFRHAIACLGAAIVLSTVLLGIHWIVDVCAGLALGVCSTWMAVRQDERVRMSRSETRAATAVS